MADTARTIEIPELCLIALVGASGSGKSTFAHKFFKPTEIISSDFCRALVSDDENNQQSTPDAFDLLNFIATKRLSRGLLTVIDATNTQPDARTPLVKLAREHDVLPVAIVLNMPESVCHERNTARPDRQFGPHVIRTQLSQLRRSIRGLEREGFRYVFVLHKPADIDQLTVSRVPLWNNRHHDSGPFDIIGDVHGCFDELHELLSALGYRIAESSDPDLFGFSVSHPQGRRVIFLGDLIDRGPKVVPVLRLAMSMCKQGIALCIPGNHEEKLNKKLRGKQVNVSHGMEQTIAELSAEPSEFTQSVHEFIDSLVSHYVLDHGRLVVAHAGIKQKYVGRTSGRVREFCLYGETTGETDEFGLPVRHNWAADYRGNAHIIYGHTPIPHPDWLNRTVNIDTGCVFGGSLTALRWPEREFTSIKSKATYAEPKRPFLPAATNLATGESLTTQPLTAQPLTAQQTHDDILDFADVSGKRIITTRLANAVTVRAENSAAALEVMSRFAANPKWLIHLPPTMSPVETSPLPDFLEYPTQAFDYFRSAGTPRVVCQQKHMGSRAIVIVCKDASVATTRFGIAQHPDAPPESGIIYTRTGRKFFDDHSIESHLLSIVRDAATAAGWWNELDTDWLCLDCELMPWSVKAQELLKSQYAMVASAGRAFSQAVLPLLETAHQRYASTGIDALSQLLARARAQSAALASYTRAYQQYCWPVHSPADIRLAPFHILASEGACHTSRDHHWHIAMIDRLAAADANKILMPTSYVTVDVTDPASTQAATQWWLNLTSHGGEGMVVKPIEFTARGHRGLIQPAIKVRGPEYLRIIYGPEYDSPNNISRLRSRALAAKRGLAIREFALGVESLERFIRRQPLREVHECTFAVLALESEPIDPRL